VTHSSKSWWKAIVALLALAAVAPALFLLLNVGGWRARVTAVLGSVYNWPVVVPPPANFQPQVPPGFKVSIFASGFKEPRWMAVAPDGDVFVADSGAGEVIVLRSASSADGVSREIFADHLNLPFGIAFRGEYVYVANSDQVVRCSLRPENRPQTFRCRAHPRFAGWRLSPALDTFARV
jgi:glucose/arabinose dehydrogenase